MAEKDDIIREDDGPGDDKGGQQQQPQQQPGRSDDTVLRPIDDLPLIRRGTERQQQKPEYEIIEVDDNDQPIGGGEDRRDEGNLSEEQGGERSLLDQRREEENRQRKNETSRERRERKKAARDRDRTENVELRRELAGLRDELDQFKTGAEKRLNAVDAGRVQSELTRIDNEIEKHNSTIRTTESAQRAALNANDADAFIAAQTQREDAVIAKARLESQKQNLKDRVDARSGRDDGDDRGDDRRGTDRREQTDNRQRQEPRPLVGAAKRYLDDFQRAHDWIDANSRDPETRRDSRRVLFLDNEVYAEGYDPSTQEYWDELESRMRDVLPHMFDDEDDEDDRRPPARSRQNGNGRDQQRQNGRAANGNGSANANGRTQTTQQTQQRRGPPLADVGGRGGNARKTQVKISPERKRALIETGSLSTDGRVIDQVKFERQLQRFAEFDARESAGR